MDEAEVCLEERVVGRGGGAGGPEDGVVVREGREEDAEEEGRR